MKHRSLIFSATLILLCSAVALAGPGRPITSGTFANQTTCGPMWDGSALQGQWFMDPTGATNVNSMEYCDDDNYLTIAGVVQNYALNASSNMVSFDILVTVSNSLPGDYQTTLNATNSHGEIQIPQTPAAGDTMRETRITAEFAIPDLTMTPPNGFAPPYWPDPVSGGGAGGYYIEAVNEHLLAWYCWDPNSGITPAGKFQVPAWNLSPTDIPPGGTAQVLMQFSITGGGMPMSDYRHGVIRASKHLGMDVLYNRHPSLKISHWLDTLLVDNGYNMGTPPPPYGQEEEYYVYASDASVFYNITEEEDPHKMHYPQYPDPNGWDVRACFSTEDGKQKVLADDFMCTSNGPITHITFWGSWLFDEFEEQDPYQGINNIHLSIHRDIPDPDPQDPSDYSMPNLPPERVWEFDPNNIPANWNFTITPEDPSMQGWYDPNTGQFFPNNHTNYFRYDVWIPADEAFVQEEGNVYWLDISVNTVYGQWGWKSTTNHWNDDAVYADIPVDSTNQWHELYEPPLFEQSLDLAFIIDGEEPQPGYDFGDAPDGALGTGPGDYQTTLADTGAYHNIIQGAPFFDDGSGSDQPDGESDGQPDPNAMGDDNNGTSPDDENGISIPVLTVGQAGTIIITVDDGAGGLGAGGGYVDAWIDFNADGDWIDANEQIFSGWILQGSSNITVNVPAGTAIGQTFGRFRINSAAAGLPSTGIWPSGSIPDGEVEDHEVYIEEPVLLDWGDAPDPTYPTLSASSGANHLLGQGIYMGASVDPDLDGQPDLKAMGDDTNLLYAGVAYPPGDEDGVILVTPLFPGTVAQINVIASAPALLNAWIDFNGDGSWTNAGEQVFTDVPLGSGNNFLPVAIPASALPGQTFARFRYSTVAGLQPTGYASDGEVEDHLFIIEDVQEVDWGDAPDAAQPMYYPTLMVNNGAHHIILPGMYLGNKVDPEPDGQPTPSSDGDDLDTVFGPPYIDDEDGVVLSSLLMPGGYATVDVIASQSGALDAWIDFGNDGSWAQPGDQIFIAQPLTSGVNSLTFPVPTTAAQGNPAYSRFRYSLGGGLPYTGFAMEGEVEDHEFYIEEVEGGIDWGDAPNSYPTLNANGGAQHTITIGVMLGAIVDNESDGQPTILANGDDTDILYTSWGDDEDGVSFTSKIVAGSSVTVNVVAGALGGNLDAWVDFNADGDWNDAGEKIFSSTPVSAGLNSLSFTAPPPPLARGTSFARFRISTAGGLPPGGVANDGEVEDYLVKLYQPAPTNLIITNLTFNASNTVATVQWIAENGIVYQMQASTNLLTNVWADVGSTVIGTNNAQTNAMSTDTNKFYRVYAPMTP